MEASFTERDTMAPNMLAQTTLEALSLGSITGIVIATMFIVEILKRLFTNVTFFQKIPVFIYAVAVSCLLTFIACRILKTKDGFPILDMDLGPALWASVIQAAAASGFYSWLRPQSVQKAMVDGSNIGPSATPSRLEPLILLCLMVFVGGCSQLADILPGNDPFVVNMERAGQSAFVICDSVVNYDHKNHDFMASKVPAAHDIVQKIRIEFPPSYTAFRAAMKEYKTNRTPVNAQVVKNQLGVLQNYQTKAQDALNTATQAKGTSDASLPSDHANYCGDRFSSKQSWRSDFTSCYDSSFRIDCFAREAT